MKIGKKNINYEQFGTGKPILFIHGWGGTIDSLKPLALLAAKKYQAIILDLPGFGQSDNPESNWGVEEYSKILIDVINKLGLNDVIYFGHSFGGSLGIYIAANYPKKISKLILSAPSFSRLNKISPATQKLKKLSQLFSCCQKIQYQLKKIYYRIFFPKSDLFKFPQLESNFRKIMTQDLTYCLPLINQPTLVLWGNKDTYISVKNADLLKLKIKNLKLKIFPDIGHNLPIKFPEIVYGELDKFI